MIPYKTTQKVWRKWLNKENYDTDTNLGDAGYLASNRKQYHHDHHTNIEACVKNLKLQILCSLWKV